jgi:hypothetical protein
MAPAEPDAIGRNFMEYMLLLYVDESGWTKLSKAEQEQGMAAYRAYSEALRKAGLYKSGSQLGPSRAAKTIRLAGGREQVLDGPYADAKEQVGGYYLIEAPDLETALSWAARCPTVGHGVVEVRQLAR